MRGVFSTRSQDRPNPIGIHRVKIVEIESSLRFNVLGMEAFDGTPIIDVKPVLDRERER
jgi:tRNA (Thr-GGU) A37 N-methylase